MGVTNNARTDTYTAGKRQSNDTVYVFDIINLPEAVSGEIQLEAKIYEIDKELTLTDTLVTDDSVIRADGSANNSFEFSGGITGLKSEKSKLVIDDVLLSDADNDCTLFDITNDAPPNGQSSIELKNGCILEDWLSLGTIRQMRVNMQSITILGAGQSQSAALMLNGVPQFVLELCFFGYRGGQVPPDALMMFYDADDLDGPFTIRDVNILNTRVAASAANNAAASFVNLHPSISADANILIAGCALLGGDPIAPFYLGDEEEITGITDNGDGTVTVLTSDTGSMADDDWLNILRTENYNGGHQVSNVTATSFDITATFVDNAIRGTWHTGSIDYRDPRVTCRDNILIPASRFTFAGYENGNTVETDIGVVNTWSEVVTVGFLDHADIIERFALCGDGTEVAFIYHGKMMLKTVVQMQVRVMCDSGGNSEDSYELGWGINGAEPSQPYTNKLDQVNANDHTNGAFFSIFGLEEGDTIKLWVRCTSSSNRDIIIEDVHVFGDEL